MILVQEEVTFTMALLFDKERRTNQVKQFQACGFAVIHTTMVGARCESWVTL
jgi:hypothetical protein